MTLDELAKNNPMPFKVIFVGLLKSFAIVEAKLSNGDFALISEENESFTLRSDDKGWELYVEPKPKVKKWLVVYKWGELPGEHMTYMFYESKEDFEKNNRALKFISFAIWSEIECDEC